MGIVVFYVLLGLFLVSVLIYAGVVQARTLRDIRDLKKRREMLAQLTPEPTHKPEPVLATLRRIMPRRYEVRFAGRWMKCVLEGGQCGSGLPPLSFVRLVDPRTHSRRIVRLLDDVREMNV